MAKPWEKDKGFQQWLAANKTTSTSTPTVSAYKSTPSSYYKSPKKDKPYKTTTLENGWKGTLLKDLSRKQYGRSYDDKLTNWVKTRGGNSEDIEGFRNWMNLREAGMRSTTGKTSKEYTGNDGQKWLKEWRKKQPVQTVETKPKKTKESMSVPKNLDSKKGQKKELPDNWFVNAHLAVDNKLLKPIEKIAGRFATNFADSYALGQPKKSLKKHEKDNPAFLNEWASPADTKTEKVTSGAGQFAGTFAPIGAAYKWTKPVAEGAFKAITRGAELGKFAKYGKDAVKGATALGTYATAREGLDELLNPKDATLKERAKDIGMESALGFFGDPATRFAGSMVKAGASKGLDTVLKKMFPHDLPKFNGKISEGTLSKLANEVEGLPKQGEPINVDPAHNVKRYSNPNQPVNEFLGKQKEDSALLQMAKKNMYENRDLPEFADSKPSIEQSDNTNVYGVNAPKDLVESAPPEYWQKRYNEFVNHVEQNYDTNKLTQEGLDDLWSQFARYDEPVTLEQAVDLAYKGYQEPKPIDTAEVWDQLGNRPPVSKNAKKIMGIDGNESLGPIENPVPPVQDTLPEMTIKKTIYKPSQQADNVIESNTTQEPSQPVKPQEIAPKEHNERGFIDTLRESDKSSEPFIDRLKSAYEPLSNEKVVELANKRVSDDIEKAVTYVKTSRKITPEHIATAHRLIDEFQKVGDYERAVDIAETIAEHGTRAGQSVQAFSIYNRLTPEGQLVRAQRRVNQINDNIGKMGQKVVITKDVAAKITETVDSIQKLTGQEDATKNVMSLMEKVKKGTALTDNELDTVRSFVSDAKKFVGDLDPKGKPVTPKKIIDTRTRDKVVDFMSKREELARKRLNETFNSRANSLPVDVFYDLSVIGASKIAKGTVKFADFSEQMVKEFGEQISPYMKQIYDKAADTFNIQSEKITSKRLSEVEKITNKALKDKSLSQDEADIIRDFARRVGSMTGDAKIDASMELQATLQALERPTLGQKISTTQTIAQLLNPKTTVRNALGNELFYRVERLTKYIATPIDWAQSKFLGGHRSVTFKTNNQGKYWENFFRGAKAGWKGVNPAGLTTAYDLGPQAFKSKYNPLTYMEKALGATLRGFDNAGYMRAYNKTIGELSTLRALNEGLTGKELKEAAKKYMVTADDNIMNIADAYGKYATFQDNTILSTGLTKLKRGLNLGKDFGLGDLVLKYPKTPGNLLMRALEYSPAGFLRSIKILAEPLQRNVSYNSPEFAMATARAITGTIGFSGLGYFLASKGILTGSGNSDFEVKSLEQSSGKQQNSMNVTALSRWINNGFDESAAETKEGDTFISYDWAQPVAIAVALGTGVSQSIKEEGKLDAVNATYAGVTGAANTMIESSVLSGVKKAFEFYPGQSVSDKAIDIAGDLPSSFVPTLSNQIRQFGDNTGRSTYDPNLMKTFLNQATNRVPSAEKKLPKSYDTLGNTKQVYQGGGNNAFNVFLNPSFVKKYNPTPEAKFVLDFINKSGEKTVAPRYAQKTISIDGERVKLSAKEYTELQRVMGKEVSKGLKDVVPQLQGETDFEKIRKSLEKVLNKAGDKARDQIRDNR